MSLPPALRRALIGFAAGGAIALAGLALYGDGDWAVAANPPVSPIMVWNECLLDGKPDSLGAEMPGITPGSRLSYRPIISSAAGSRSLSGWEFFGKVTRDDSTVQFTCTTDAAGGQVRWTTTIP